MKSFGYTPSLGYTFVLGIGCVFFFLTTLWLFDGSVNNIRENAILTAQRDSLSRMNYDLEIDNYQLRNDNDKVFRGVHLVSTDGCTLASFYLGNKDFDWDVRTKLAEVYGKEYFNEPDSNDVWADSALYGNELLIVEYCHIDVYPYYRLYSSRKETVSDTFPKFDVDGDAFRQGRLLGWRSE